MVSIKKFGLLFSIFLVSVSAVQAFFIIGPGSIAILAFKGIIYHIIIIIIGFVAGMKLRLFKHWKLDLIILGSISILFIFSIFSYKFFTFNSINRDIINSLESESELMTFFNANYIDLNMKIEDYSNYKVVSLASSDTSLGLKNTQAYIGECSYNINCIIEKFEEANIKKEDSILLYCASGISSSKLGLLLKEMGYEKIKVTGISNINNEELLSGLTFSDIKLEDYIIINKLDTKDIQKYNWIFVFFNNDDMFSIHPSIKGRIYIINPIDTTNSTPEMQHMLNISKEYNIKISNKISANELPSNSRFMCTSGLNCLLSQEFVYQNNLGVKKIYRLVEPLN